MSIDLAGPSDVGLTGRSVAEYGTDRIEVDLTDRRPAQAGSAHEFRFWSNCEVSQALWK
ncbi:hypothetical protein [Kitasatospora sp. NPDC002965]|uniref:hypothetical protein n=1 Tax=Kitasatospora sp. NPDC002965 TaxID=3154775 RepID=UPI0033BE20EB